VDAGSPVGRTLIVQSWMAEGGAWVAAEDMRQGAVTFISAAEAAREVPHSLFAVESYRAAAQCWHLCGEHEKAMETAMLGVQEARAMTDSDRPPSTVPQLLHDILRMHDAGRCERIERCAVDYEKKVLQAQVNADRDAYRLGTHPEGQAIEKIEKRLVQDYERAFKSLLVAREELVMGGSEIFQTVVALGRKWLNPTWAGLPDVRHPLDMDFPEWTDPPTFAVLPDPQPMLETA